MAPKTHILISLESPGVFSGLTSKLWPLGLPGGTLLVLGVMKRHKVVTEELALGRSCLENVKPNADV